MEQDTWNAHTFSLFLLIVQKREYTIGKLSSDRQDREVMGLTCSNKTRATGILFSTLHGTWHAQGYTQHTSVELMIKRGEK